MSVLSDLSSLAGRVWLETLAGGCLFVCLFWARERGYGTTLLRSLLLAVVLYPVLDAGLHLVTAIELIQIVLISLGFGAPIAMSIIAIRYIAAS